MVGDVASIVEESIKDEVGDSHSRFSNSRMSNRNNSRDNSAQDQGRRSGKAASAPPADKGEALLVEIEKAIDSERSDREDRLARDLKKRRISPRTYDKGIKEIEKWVIGEKKELNMRRRKLMENQSEMNRYLERFSKDKQSIPTLAKIASPRVDSARKSYLDDSANSDHLQAANR